MKKVVWLFKEYENNEHSSAVIFWYGILEQLGYEVIYYPYEDYNPDKFYEEMKLYKPDYIFHCVYDGLHLEFQRLREFCKVYVVHSDDDWRFNDHSKFYIPFVDGAISYQGYKENYLKEGAIDNQIISLKWSFNPNTMIMDLSDNKDILLSHIGSLYGERPYIINKFIEKGIDTKILQRSTYSEVLSILNRSKYSLCLTKASQGNFRQKKGRVAEIPFYSVLFSEYFPQLENYYDINKEIVVFETVEEAVDKIKFYENNHSEYQKILISGRNRLIKTNTVYHEWDRAMKIIDEKYNPININDILIKHNLI